MKTVVNSLTVNIGDELSICDSAYRITMTSDYFVKGVKIVECGCYVKLITECYLDLRLPGWKFIYVAPIN